jgi:hypothetical protein
MGLVVMACALLGIREPMDFYHLSPAAQGWWLDHVRNLVTRAYEPPPQQRKPQPQTASDAAKAMAAFLASKESCG